MAKSAFFRKASKSARGTSSPQRMRFFRASASSFAVSERVALMVGFLLDRLHGQEIVEGGIGETTSLCVGQGFLAGFCEEAARPPVFLYQGGESDDDLGISNGSPIFPAGCAGEFPGAKEDGEKARGEVEGWHGFLR